MSDTLGGCEPSSVVASLDRDDELGEVAVADYPSDLLLGDERAGCGPPRHRVCMSPFASA